MLWLKTEAFSHVVNNYDKNSAVCLNDDLVLPRKSPLYRKQFDICN